MCSGPWGGRKLEVSAQQLDRLPPRAMARPRHLKSPVSLQFQESLAGDLSVGFDTFVGMSSGGIIDRDAITAAFDALDDAVAGLGDLNFDALTTRECLALLERCERVRRRPRAWRSAAEAEVRCAWERLISRAEARRGGAREPRRMFWTARGAAWPPAAAAARRRCNSAPARPAWRTSRNGRSVVAAQTAHPRRAS